MLTSGINLVNYKKKFKTSYVSKTLKSLLKEKNQSILSLSKFYKNNFDSKLVKKYKNNLNFKVIGMGGSSLGTQTIYDFLKEKIKKNFIFIDNLESNSKKIINKKFVNLVVSKSGNTTETIINSNFYIKKNDINIFITENKKNYLHDLAKQLKAEIVHHNNYIGGRYSVLSEVGMLPAELMGLDCKKFRQYNSLIKNKKFLNSLILNVGSTLYFVKKKKFNSVIFNYDPKSESLFKWYQQLVAESLGKNKQGILPVVSTMPKDNHSVMQLYLDGLQNNFFTFFYVKDKNSKKINNDKLLSSHNFLRNKTLSKIIHTQKIATENVFIKKNIPFRSFEIYKRDEKALGELFCFFLLEIILIGRCLKLNPFNQPAVELLKKETKKLLI